MIRNGHLAWGRVLARGRGRGMARGRGRALVRGMGIWKGWLAVEHGFVIYIYVEVEFYA